MGTGAEGGISSHSQRDTWDPDALMCTVCIERSIDSSLPPSLPSTSIPTLSLSPFPLSRSVGGGASGGWVSPCPTALMMIWYEDSPCSRARLMACGREPCGCAQSTRQKGAAAAYCRDANSTRAAGSCAAGAVRTKGCVHNGKEGLGCQGEKWME